MQCEQGDEELGQIAEGRLHDAGPTRAETRAELLGRRADRAGQERERRRSDDEGHDIADAGEVADRRGGDDGSREGNRYVVASRQRRGEAITGFPRSRGSVVDICCRNLSLCGS